MNSFMTFDKYRVFETEFAGRPLKVETGKMTQLANGACLVTYGETVVHCAVTASAKPREGVDFFPLSVDYEEKLYSVGRIPGSYLKREGRPSEHAILTSRVIDRPIRPLFDKSMRNDVSIVCTVMSVDPDCQPEIVAMIGASIAISISDVPWNGPISGCSVGMIDGEYIILEYCGWHIGDEQVFMSTLNTYKTQPKNIVLIKDGVITEHHFEEKMGAYLKSKDLTKEEKQSLKETYEQWKSKSSTPR